MNIVMTLLFYNINFPCLLKIQYTVTEYFSNGIHFHTHISYQTEEGG